MPTCRKRQAGFTLCAWTARPKPQPEIQKNIYMKNLLKATALAVLLALPATVQAQLSTYVGIAESIGNIIRGTTTVTPSFCINSWDSYGKTDDPDFGTERERLTVRYDHILGTYYYSQSVEYDPFPASTDTTPFPVSTVALQNFYCNDGEGTVTIAAQTYTIWITCTVTSTGLTPPGPPYEVSFKTTGTSLPGACFVSSKPGATREFRKTYNIDPAQGGVVGRVGNPNYSFAWPFQCWAGDPYQF